MRKWVSIGSVFCFLLLANFVQAQGRGPVPQFHSEFRPVVGGWAEYEMKAKDQAPVKMKFAVVGKEGNDYWFENVMESGREGKTITKMLVSGDPNDSKNVKRMIVKTGKRPPIEMPLQMMGRAKGRASAGKAIDKGQEMIKVPAGTFTTHHFQHQAPEGVVDVWVHKDISPYGLVKSQSKDSEMVLLGYGTGARTEITEEPRKFKMPSMPQVPSQIQIPKTPGKVQPGQAPAEDEDEDEDDEDEEDE